MYYTMHIIRESIAKATTTFSGSIYFPEYFRKIISNSVLAKKLFQNFVFAFLSL